MVAQQGRDCKAIADADADLAARRQKHGCTKEVSAGPIYTRVSRLEGAVLEKENREWVALCRRYPSL